MFLFNFYLISLRDICINNMLSYLKKNQLYFLYFNNFLVNRNNFNILNFHNNYNKLNWKKLEIYKKINYFYCNIFNKKYKFIFIKKKIIYS